MINGNQNSYPPTLQDLRTKIITWLLDQGIAIVIMLTVMYVLYTERQTEREAAQACNQEIIDRLNETIRSQHDQNAALYKLLERIDSNTTDKQKKR